MVYGCGRIGPGRERAPIRAAPAAVGFLGEPFGPRALRFSR